MAGYEFLVYAQDGAVATVTLNRPEALNALSRPLEAELHRALDEAAADASVRAIILTGAGRAFSAGYDISGGIRRRARADRPVPARALAPGDA